MNKKDCKIIQELLPNYVENLTNDEVMKYVEDHLKDCKECKKICEDMGKDFYKKETIEKESINYLKKHKKKLRILQTIIFIIIVLYLISISRKLIIITSIENKAENQNFNNYYVKMKETTNSKTSEWESYYKDGNFVVTTSKYTSESIERTYQYKNDDVEIYINEKNGKKEIMNSKPSSWEHYNFLNRSFIGNLGLALAHNNVDQIKFNKRDCYIIKIGNSYLNIIDKETGLTIKEINLLNNIVVDYTYVFDVVTDEDIIERKPEL